MNIDNGRDEVLTAIRRSPDPERLADELGIRGLSWLVRAVLDAHYPEAVFPWRERQYGVNWASEHAGEEIDPGVKWVALLRMALDALPSEPVREAV